MGAASDGGEAATERARVKEPDQNGSKPGQPTSWRPLVIVALFSALPFTTFLAKNALEAELREELLLYPLLLFGAGVVVLLVVRQRDGWRSAERFAVVFAAATFMLFKFLAVSRGLSDLGLPAGYVATFAVWLVLSACVILGAVRVSRSPLAWTYAMVVGGILVAVSAWQYAFAPNRSSLAEARGRIPAAVDAARQSERPDVWFFLLDGYGRADVLQEEAGHDNRPFLDQLRKRGFSVEGAAAASFPRTVPSLATTLAMDYTLEDGRIPRDLHNVVRGDNATVRSFQALDYKYVAATDYALLECEEFADVCLYPPAGADIGSTRWAVLRATPIPRLLEKAESALSGGELENVLAPDEVVREVKRRRGEEPVFVYTHLILPHPPYRYRRDCSRVPVDDSDLSAWKATPGHRSRYADSVRCSNLLLVKAVDAILADRPDSIIVLQGDHGPGFGVPLTTPPNDWRDAELLQRFAILSALRPGPSCRQHVRAPVVPVNTFRLVLSCVTGRRIPELAPRRYSAAYGESALEVDRLRTFDFSPRP